MNQNLKRFCWSITIFFLPFTSLNFFNLLSYCTLRNSFYFAHCHWTKLFTHFLVFLQPISLHSLLNMDKWRLGSCSVFFKYLSPVFSRLAWFFYLAIPFVSFICLSHVSCPFTNAVLIIFTVVFVLMTIKMASYHIFLSMLFKDCQFLKLCSVGSRGINVCVCACVILVDWSWQGKTMVLKENMSQYHFFHCKSCMDWPGTQPGPSLWEASDELPKPWHSLTCLITLHLPYDAMWPSSPNQGTQTADLFIYPNICIAYVGF